VLAVLRDVRDQTERGDARTLNIEVLTRNA
jgi:hypothetical protein